jgi:hypothetical protein
MQYGVPAGGTAAAGYPPPYGYGCFAALGAFGAVADFATWPRTAPPTRAGSMPAPPPKRC